MLHFIDEEFLEMMTGHLAQLYDKLEPGRHEILTCDKGTLVLVKAKGRWQLFFEGLDLDKEGGNHELFTDTHEVAVAVLKRTLTRQYDTVSTDIILIKRVISSEDMIDVDDVTTRVGDEIIRIDDDIMDLHKATGFPLTMGHYKLGVVKEIVGDCMKIRYTTGKVEEVRLESHGRRNRYYHNVSDNITVCGLRALNLTDETFE